MGAIKETLEQMLSRDILDIADGRLDEGTVDGWVEHIKSTFGLYGWKQELSNGGD